MSALMGLVPWYAWSIVANLSITGIEYLNRTGAYDNPGQAFLRTGPAILLAQIGLFYAWRDAPSFMFAWAFFFIGSTITRIVSAKFFVEEPLSLTVLAGVAFIMGGALLVKTGVGTH